MNKKLKVLLLHPVFFSIFPIISLYSCNSGKVSLSEFLPPFFTVLICSILILFILTKFLKIEESKAALITTNCSLFIFGYWTFKNIFDAIAKEGNPIFIFISNNFPEMWILYLLFIFYAIIIIKTPLINLTKILNLISAYLILSCLFIIANHELNTKIEWDKVITSKQIPIIKGRKTSLPDIYYIIPDRYASSYVLKQYYNFDNSDFINFLKTKGFYVAEKSRSNYLSTTHSVSSSLNLEHINFLSNLIHGDKTNYHPMYARLKDYKVWRFLKSQGYKFIHAGSWWEPTRLNKYADEEIHADWLNDFSRVLYCSTSLYPIFTKLGIKPMDERWSQWKRVYYKFNKFKKIPHDKESTFLFAHILVPHPPYIFDRDGNFLKEDIVKNRSTTRNYTEQVLFINKKLKELINEILSSSETPPIIIIQSDEGPVPTRREIERENFDWHNATLEEFDEKTGILNAYYLPGFDQKKLYPEITPVNSFGLVLNHYFGTSFKKLPDRIYAHKDGYNPYDFFDITDKTKQ